MDIQHLTFGLKDVFAIVGVTASVLGVYYALKSSIDKIKVKTDSVEEDLKHYKESVEEKFFHAKNSKKANIQMIMDTIAQHKQEVDKKETQIYNRIGEIREEQKAAHEKMWQKLESVADMQQKMNTSLAELTGFLRGKRDE